MRPVLVPQYIEKFSCIGSACEDTCCAGWSVTVDKKAYNAYRNVRDPLMAPQLKQFVKRNRKAKNDLEFGKIILGEDKKCQLMLEDGLCSIHKHLGEDYLCTTCAVYPRMYKQVDEIVEKSLTLSCPEAARLVLLQQSGLDFIETEEPKATRGPINRKLSTKAMPLFWDLRIFVIQLLQDRRQPLEIRLVLLGLFMKKIEALSPKELEQQLPAIMEDYMQRLTNTDYIESLQQLEGDLFFQINLARYLTLLRVNKYGMQSQKHANLLTEMLKGLKLYDEQTIGDSLKAYKDTVTELYVPFMAEHDYMLENYLVNYVFKNLFPYDYSTLFESYQMLVIHFALIKTHIIGVGADRQQITPELVVECVQQLAKTMEHSGMYTENVRKHLDDSGFVTMGHMFSIIKS